MSIKGHLFNIENFAIYDGPGIRTVVYLKGCPLRCFWCHNPESWDQCSNSGFYKTTDELLAILLKDILFYKNSNGGVTLSGGEPTIQKEFILELLLKLKEKNIHTAIETCGFFSSSILNTLEKVTDLFLFDLKHLDPLKHKSGTNISNELIISNFKLLLKLVGNTRVIVRIPMIPGFNNDETSLNNYKKFLYENNFNGLVQILPYHNLYKSKVKDKGSCIGLKIEDKNELLRYKVLGEVLG